MRKEALVVGINRYPMLKLSVGDIDLDAPAADAQAIADCLRKSGGFNVNFLPERYDVDGRKVDSQGKVKFAQLQTAIANLFNPPDKPPEVALLFFSGHGGLSTIGGVEEGFLITSNTSRNSTTKALRNGLSLRWLRELLQKSPVKQQIVWLDCCFSGQLLNFDEVDPSIEGKFDEVDPGIDGKFAPDRCLISGSRSFQTSQEELSGEHSVFTRILLDALNPENHVDGWVTNYTLVEQIEKLIANTKQRPVWHNSGGAIILTTNQPTRQVDERYKGQCPYRSLSSFTEEKDGGAEFFYGRTRLTDELLEKVRTDNFVAVLGASGSGKSSVLRAGLLYQLKQGQKISGSDRWQYIEPFTPRENPLERLKQKLQDKVDLSFNSSTGKEQADNQRVVLIIDQFEESFTMCQDKEERKNFFDYLMQLIDNPHYNICLIIGMRADFLGQCAEYLELAEKIDQRTVTVKPMNEDEIKEAIREPAELVGLQVKDDLVNQIVNDVKDYPGSLPLLQFTLTQLWEKAQESANKNYLLIDTYKTLGGIEKTLENRANNFYENQLSDKGEKPIVQRIFLKLTQTGEIGDIRRRVKKAKLINKKHTEDLLNPIIEKLVKEAKLITIDEDGELDLIHEALIRHWEKLKQWKKDYQAPMIIERRIEEAANVWTNKGKVKEPGLLLQGLRLLEAEEYLRDYGNLAMLNGVAWDYVQESREYARIQALDAELKEKLLKLNYSLSLRYTPQELIEAIKLTTKSQRDQKSLESTVVNDVNYCLFLALAKIWDRHIFEGHTKSVNTIALSPDGTKIISGSDDNTIRLWNADSGRLLHTLKGHTESVNVVAFSPDGTKIISGSDDNTIRLWNAGSGRLLHTLKGHTESVNVVAFSPKGRTIISGSEDKTIRSWDNASGRLLHTLKGHTESVNVVAFSPDGRTIISGSDDKTIRLWNNASGRLLHTLKGHTESVNVVAFSPDGTKIISGSDDNTIRLWNTESVNKLSSFLREISLRKKRLYLFFDQLFDKLWSSNLGKKLFHLFFAQLVQILEGHQDAITAISWSPDGQKILSLGSFNDYTMCLWDSISGQLLRTFDGYPTGGYQPTLPMAWSPDGKKIISANQGLDVRLWDSTSGQLIHTFEGHTGSIDAITFSPDGTQILSTGSRNTYCLWNCESGQLIHTFQGVHSRAVDMVTAITFSPDPTRILAVNIDNIFCLYDSQSGQLLYTFKSGHTHFVDVITFSPDGTQILSGSRDNTLSLYDSESGQLIHTFEGHTGSINAITFSPDGTQILSASDDENVKLWDSVSGKLIHTFEDHTESVVAITFSPDGRQILSASKDGNVKLWRGLNGKGLLEEACKQLQFHPALVAPENKEAAEACLIYGGWDEEAKADFRKRMDVASKND